MKYSYRLRLAYLCMLSTSILVKINGQDRISHDFNLNVSHPTSTNVNANLGTFSNYKIQDFKRSTGRIQNKILKLGCSCALVNTTNQNKNNVIFCMVIIIILQRNIYIINIINGTFL